MLFSLHFFEMNSLNVQSKTTIVLCVLICLFVAVLGISAEEYYALLEKVDEFATRSARAKSRKILLQKSWQEEQNRFSNRMFYRLFRMERPCFNNLCSKIEKAVGKKNFKSEKYIQDLEKMGFATRESRMFHCHRLTSGDYISGEFKVAITL